MAITLKTTKPTKIILSGGLTGPKGVDGVGGAAGATGPGVPTGGSTNQVLRKTSATDHDTAWSSETYADDASVETAYNNQVGQVSLSEKVAGTETATRRFSPKDVKDIVSINTSSDNLTAVPNSTIVGRNDAGTGDSENLTAAEVRTILNVEDGADATDAGSVAAAGATMNTDADISGNTWVVDEDTMSSNSATKVPTQQSTKAYVDAAVADLVDSSPGTLDTLNEIAAAIGDDANYAATTAASIATKVTGPASSTDNAIARFDGTTGKIIKSSSISVDDSGNITTSGTVDGRDLSADGAALDLLLYQYPSFSSFTIPGQASPVEVGTDIGSASVTFNWVATNSSNVNAASVIISDSGGDLATGLDPSGSEAVTLPVTTLSTSGSKQYTVTGTNSLSDDFVRNLTINWYWRAYHGTSASVTLDESAIEALTGTLSSDGLEDYSFLASDYKYVCFPSSLPAASLFTDTQTGFDVAMADSSDNAAYSTTENGISFATVSVTNTNGITTDYRVYRTKYTLGSAITIGVS